MAKVLILEDNLVELYNTAKELETCNHEVIKASSTDKADYALKNLASNSLNCIIIDLNLSHELLEDEYKDKTNGGAITGWIWLYFIVRPKLENSPLIIIYSEFIEELNDYIKDLATPGEIGFFNTTKRITKAEIVDNPDIIINLINNCLK